MCITNYTGKYHYLLCIFFTFLCLFSKAAIVVTPASGGTNLSADKSAGSSNDSFTTLGNIIIASNLPTDFTLNQSNVTFVLSAPANWEFEAGAGSVIFSGSTLTAASVNITSSTITVTYSTNATSASDNSITISGIKVRATSKAIIASINIRRTAGTGTIAGFTNGGATNCGSLSQIAGTFVKLQILLPGETTAPATATGKTGAPTARSAGTAFNVTVNAVDENWNRVTTITDVVNITTTDATGASPANAALAAGTRANFSVTLRTIGSATITATDVSDGTKAASTSPTVTINAGAFSRLQTLLPGETAAPGTATGKTGTPTAVTSGTTITVTVNAVDAAYNLINTVTDAVAITSSDVNATLPANTALMAGTQTFNITLKTAAARTVTASDVTDATKTAGVSASVTVNVGAFVKLQILLPGETTAPGTATGKTGTPIASSAGTAFNVTVNAVDEHWNRVTTVTDVVNITSTDATAALPANAALTAGTRNNFAVTLRTIGSATITATDVSDGTKTASTSPTVTINAGAFSRLQTLLPGETAAPGTATGKTGTPTAITSGSTITVTVNAVDAAYNLINTVTDVVAITSSDVNATLPANTALMAGTQTFNVTLKTAAARTVTASDVTDATKTAGVSTSVTVNAGAFVKLQILLPGETASAGSATGKTGTPNAVTAGTAFNATVNAVDEHWNRVITVTDMVNITTTDAGATVGANNTLAAGTRNFALTLRAIGSATITATNITDGTKTASISAMLTINGGVFSRLQILLPGETAAPGTATGKTGTPTAVTSGTTITVIVNAVDAAYNLINTVTDAVAITSSDANATLPANAALMAGTQTFNVTLKTAAARTVTASDVTDATKTAGVSASVTVNVGAFVKLQILLPGETTAPGTSTGKTGTPTARSAGTAFNVTVNAVDEHWNRVITVTDVVNITSTDATAALPANAALTAGTRNNFAVTLRTIGSATITATDVTNAAKTASISATVTINGGVFSRLQILLPGETAAPGTTTGKTGTPTSVTSGSIISITVNAVDAAYNLINTVTDIVAITSSDANATLAANAALTAGTQTFNVILKTAGARTITASNVTDATKTAATSASVTVNSGAFVKFQILLPGETASAGSATGKTGTPTARLAGTAFNVTVNAVDEHWNRITTVTDIVNISTSDATAALPANVALAAGTRANFSVTLRTIGSASITATNVTDGTKTANTSPAVTVNVGPFTRLQLLLPGETPAPGTATGKTGTPIAITAGAIVSVTVNAVDAAFNLITTATDEVGITSSDVNAVLPANSALIAGIQTFNIKLKTAGARTITASDITDGSKTANTSPSTTVNAGAFTQLQILLPGEAASPGSSTGKTGIQTPPARGVAFAITVRGVDDNFNIVTSATNSITITSNDVAATLPAASALAAGTRNFTLTLNSAGTQIITATGASFNTNESVYDGVTPSLITDHFRSLSNGNWANAASWQSSPEGLTWQNATLAPNNNSNRITILNGHTITIAANVTADQITIEAGGKISVNTGITFTVANGTGTDLEVAGTLTNAGIITPSGTIAIQSTGIYQHAFTTTAGTVPAATWNSGSTCEIKGYTSATGTVGGMNQTFSNLVWNCTGQNVAAGISMGGTFSTTNLTITSTGTANVQLATTGGTITVTGNYIHTGGTLTLNNTSGTTNLNLTGNFSLTGGTLQKGTGAGNVNFVGSSVQYFTKSSSTITGAVQFVVNSGANLDFGTSVLDGTATVFTLASGGTILTGNTTGISSAGASGSIQTLTRNFNTGANYIYNGSIAQVTGNGLPLTVNNLKIDNSAGVTFPATVSNYTISGVLNINAGWVDMVTNRLSGGAGFSTLGSGLLYSQNISATPIPSGKTWSVGVEYNGNSAQTIIAGTYNNISFTGAGVKTSGGGTITINGDWDSNNGKIDFLTNATTVIFNGTTQNLSDNSNGEDGVVFKNVTFGNSGIKTLVSGRFSVSGRGLLNVSGTATLASNSNLHIISDVTGTGDIGPLSAGSDITGDVNVQSVIHGNNLSTYRGTRSISSPINDSGLAKKTFEQLKDFIIITGPGNTSNGFDLGGSIAPNAITLQSYNEPGYLSSGSFIPVPSIYENAIPGKGYYIFYRGGRTNMANKINPPFLAPENVTVNFKGPINKNDISLELTNSHNIAPEYAQTDALNGYNFVGNPYPCAIDWDIVRANSTNLDDVIMIVKAGGGTATCISGITNGGGSQYIQPGQGFFVRVNNAFNTGTVKFTESAKITNVAPPRLLGSPVLEPLLSFNSSSENHQTTANKLSVLRISLKDDNSTDETTIGFKKGFSKASIDDALYFSGPTVSLGSLSGDGKNLAINLMPELVKEDTIRLSVNAEKSEDVHLLFTELDIPAGFSVFLIDSLLGTKTNIKENPRYNFYIDKTIRASYGTKRFSLVFKQLLPVIVNSFSAKKLSSAVRLSFITNSENNLDYFELEKASDSINFTSIKRIPGLGNPNNSARTYTYLDNSPRIGLNFYRIKQVTKDGYVQYSEIEIADFNTLAEISNSSGIEIYPNPVKDLLNVNVKAIVNSPVIAIYSLTGGKLFQSSEFDPYQKNFKLNVDKLSPGIFILEIKSAETNELIGRTKFIKE